MQTRFDKITDRYKGRNSKRSQKERKIERKNANNKQLEEPIKTRGRKRKEQSAVTQMLEQIDERCEAERAGEIKKRLRAQSGFPLSEPRLTKEKAPMNKQVESKSKSIKQKDIKQKEGKEKEKERKENDEKRAVEQLRGSLGL